MNLSILQWNACGLKAHSAELKQYVATADFKPSIICIQETFLKPQHDFSFHGYSVERRGRLHAAKGGAAMLIMDSLSYSVVDSERKIESLTIQITLASGKKLSISNIYNPPNQGIKENNDDYVAIFACRNGIIVGDLNSHSTLWGSRATDNNGAFIESLLDAHDLV